jgi:hypothetical protein
MTSAGIEYSQGAAARSDGVSDHHPAHERVGHGAVGAVFTAGHERHGEDHGDDPGDGADNCLEPELFEFLLLSPVA